jgi:hypothetical protein
MARERKPERVGPEEKLGDIMSWEILFAVCKCEHYAEVDIRALRLKCGGDATLRKLEPKLRCKKCGETGKPGFFVMRMPR